MKNQSKVEIVYKQTAIYLSVGAVLLIRYSDVVFPLITGCATDPKRRNM